MVLMGIEYECDSFVETETGTIWLYQAYLTENGVKTENLPTSVSFEEDHNSEFFGVWAVHTPTGTYLKQINAPNEDDFFNIVIELSAKHLLDGSIG